MGNQKDKYYWFIMKKIVNVKKCTILLHVDELNMSHVDYEIGSSVLANIDA